MDATVVIGGGLAALGGLFMFIARGMRERLNEQGKEIRDLDRRLTRVETGTG